VRYGVGLANIGTYADPRATISVARAAEAAGWEALLVWDHLAFTWGQAAADPWVTLAAVSAATRELRIGTAVTPVARRRPQVLAQQVATLDVLSGGRVVFGAGLGGSPSEFGKFGEPTDERVRADMLDEGLDVLRRLWSGAEVRHRGKHYTVEGVRLAPTPQQEHLPIWIGGNRPASVRRAARWDGWIPDTPDPKGRMLAPDDIGRRIETIRELRGSLDGFDVALLGYSDRAEPAAYEAAGATWWLENVHDLRGSQDEMLALVGKGPPSGG
jgi:probable F420-dependent oxidoreductase